MHPCQPVLLVHEQQKFASPGKGYGPNAEAAEYKGS